MYLLLFDYCHDLVQHAVLLAEGSTDRCNRCVPALLPTASFRMFQDRLSFEF